VPGAPNSPACDPGLKRRDPFGKVLMLSVISHFTNEAEHPELAASASAGPVQLVGREDIVAGTDCGFAQGLFYRRVHPSMMWGQIRGPG